MDCVDWLSAVSLSCGGDHIGVPSPFQGLEVQIWQEKNVYSCPKNYPIKREFGMWYHVDHLLLKSCSNTIKSLGNNWTDILELVMETHTCQTPWWDLWRSQVYCDCDTLATWPICYVQFCCWSTPLRIMTLTMFWIIEQVEASRVELTVAFCRGPWVVREQIASSSTALVVLKHWC